MEKHSKSKVVVYLQCYFVTIATILGTGILGLPVTLTRAGLYPFLITFIASTLMQFKRGLVINSVVPAPVESIALQYYLSWYRHQRLHTTKSCSTRWLLIYYFTDLLQRACAVQIRPQDDHELVPLQSLEDDSDEEIFTKPRANGVNRGEGRWWMKYNTIHPPWNILMPVMPANSPVDCVRDSQTYDAAAGQRPNLHLLGELFLACGVRHAFDVMVILQFIALMICYALAGSEAFAELVGVSHIYVIPGFVWILAVAVVFGLKLIQPVVSILTFLKGSLLLGTTLVTFYVGMSVGREVKNDFRYTGEPFLMGTVALGGIINTMPFMYEKIEFNAKQISRYRLSVLLGLLTCSVLNVLWCWSVLDIVPQTVEMACMTDQLHYMHQTASLSTPDVPLSAEQVTQVCTGELSLESAADHGEISTLPLTKILQRDYPRFNWVAILIELFIVISITVSYLTVGTALHHTLSGWVESNWNQGSFIKILPKFRNKDTCRRLNGRWLCTVTTSLVAFVIIFIVAILDPQGFVQILEKFASFTLNTQAGVFVFLMLLKSRNKENRNVELALPLPRCLSYLLFLLPIYFGFAVVYDVYSTIFDIIEGRQHHPIILPGNTTLQHSAVWNTLHNITGLANSTGAT